MQQRFDASSLNPVQYARAVRCPALVLTGVDDPWVKGSEARTVTNAMSGFGSFHEFAAAGHADFARRAPAEYRQTLKEWLDKMRASGDFGG